MQSLHCKISGLLLGSMIQFNEHKSIAITAHLETAIKQLVTKRSEMLTVGKKQSPSCYQPFSTNFNTHI